MLGPSRGLAREGEAGSKRSNRGKRAGAGTGPTRPFALSAPQPPRSHRSGRRPAPARGPRGARPRRRRERRSVPAGEHHDDHGDRAPARADDDRDGDVLPDRHEPGPTPGRHDRHSGSVHPARTLRRLDARPGDRDAAGPDGGRIRRRPVRGLAGPGARLRHGARHTRPRGRSARRGQRRRLPGAARTSGPRGHSSRPRCRGAGRRPGQSHIGWSGRFLFLSPGCTAGRNRFGRHGVRRLGGGRNGSCVPEHGAAPGLRGGALAGAAPGRPCAPCRAARTASGRPAGAGGRRRSRPARRASRRSAARRGDRRRRPRTHAAAPGRPRLHGRRLVLACPAGRARRREHRLRPPSSRGTATAGVSGGGRDDAVLSAGGRAGRRDVARPAPPAGAGGRGPPPAADARRGGVAAPTLRLRVARAGALARRAGKLEQPGARARRLRGLLGARRRRARQPRTRRAARAAARRGPHPGRHARPAPPRTSRLIRPARRDRRTGGVFDLGVRTTGG